MGCISATSISIDRKSTRLNSSHLVISYAVFCLKKKIMKLDVTDDAYAEAAIGVLSERDVHRVGVVNNAGISVTTYLNVPLPLNVSFFFFNDAAPTEIYTLSLHDALPIYIVKGAAQRAGIKNPAPHDLRRSCARLC